MKITKITSQIKKPGRFNVFLDEQFWLGVSADTLARFKLYDGLELSDNDASEITKAEIRSRLIER
ncbi:recombination regulator RecX, partial [Candidatus Dojkabacteria bacterium]|nr:recombination regulator RecX [Candidatus Dojkabacteria bacterium]